MATAYIGIGSNVGDRAGHIESALAALDAEPGARILRTSRVRETEPVGGPEQRPYLNAVVAIRTDLSASVLLRTLKRLESTLGRTPGPRWGPREIDLDLLLIDDLVRRDEDLEIPHPRLENRAFVLEPLAEIAPEVIHPAIGRTIRDLWESYRREQKDATCG